MIMNDFYNFNFALLTKSNLALNHRDAKSEEFFEEDENGVEKIHEKAYLQMFDRLSIREIDVLSKPILGVTIIFGIFDVYLESKYVNIQGKSYRQKHDLLPVTNNMEIMQKSFFRIYKLIRNAITHSVHSITYANGWNDINYNFNSTNFSLKISDSSLIELYTATMLLINDRFVHERGEQMKEGLLKWYYDIIFSGLPIADDCTPVSLLSSIVPLNPIRNIITNAEYCVINDYIVIKNSKFSRKTTRDFAISFQGNCYVIPEEHLSNNSILIFDLINWKSDFAYLSVR